MCPEGSEIFVFTKKGDVFEQKNNKQPGLSKVRNPEK